MREMDDKDSRLVYSTEPEKIIRIARERGFSTERIVKQLTLGRTYQTRKEIGKKYCPIIGINLAAFMKIARGMKP